MAMHSHTEHSGIDWYTHALAITMYLTRTTWKRLMTELASADLFICALGC